MSTEVQDVQTAAENVPATSTTTAPASEPSTFAELMATWTPEERRTWDETGKEPEPKSAAPPVIDDKAKPAPETAKNEPEAGSGEEDQEDEPEYFGTPEQQKKQRHAFARLKRERAEARAEAKILREQLAGKAPAAPAAAPKAEPKAAETELAEPELPNIDDFTEAKEYHEAMKKYHREVRAYDKAQLAKEIEAERKTQAAQAKRQEAGSFWQSELKEARAELKDFDKTVLNNPAFEVSLPMAGVLMSMKGGAKVMHYLAHNPEEAAALLQETDIPGTFQNYFELVEAAESDPRLARQLGEAEAVVKSAAKHILNGSAKTDPKPITVTRATPPAPRVDTGGSPAKDPIVQAEEDYARTGDHKYLRLMNELMDKRDQEASRRR